MYKFKLGLIIFHNLSIYIYKFILLNINDILYFSIKKIIIQ
jgi:hypothetical protein